MIRIGKRKQSCTLQKKTSFTSNITYKIYCQISECSHGPSPELVVKDTFDFLEKEIL